MIVLQVIVRVHTRTITCKTIIVFFQISWELHGNENNWNLWCKEILRKTATNFYP